MAIFVLLLIGLAGLSILLTIVGTRSENWNRAYRGIAKKYGGDLKASGIFSRPSLRFRYGETVCFLNTLSREKTFGCSATQLAMRWPEARFRLEILPHGSANKNWGLSGTHEHETRNSAIRNRVIMKTNDSETTEAMLSSGVAWQLERLLQFQRRDQLHVMITRGYLYIRKPTYILDPTELDDFVRFALEFHDQAQLTRSVGIGFMEHEQITNVADATCQICGEKISEQVAICVRCMTPHCRECWEYYGQCGTFGCGERRFASSQEEIKPLP
jgi:Prokaryotic RING finger family 1